MTLGELIEFLEKYPANQEVPLGFEGPHSYRGYYEDLAFEPAKNVTVGSMLQCAKDALGQTFCGYKGGDYKMEEYTDVWLSEYGATGESIGPVLLTLMLKK
jgi:hypothetical protein